MSLGAPDSKKGISGNLLKSTYGLLVAASIVLAILKFVDVIYLPWIFVLLPFIVSNIVVLPLIKRGLNKGLNKQIVAKV